MEPYTTVEQPAEGTRSLTILVADNAPDCQATLRGWLEECGHTVVSASNGNEAIRLLHRISVDLVVTEVVMPNGDGLELILELKKWQPSARVIAVSGGGQYLHVSDCLQVASGLGAHEALPKPLSRSDLLDAMARVCSAAAVPHSTAH